MLITTPRISASSYSNTAPLIWSFLYGSQHGGVELILDNAPARSAELLAQDRVDAALVPVIAYQQLDGIRVVPDVCVGAMQRARSVCVVTRGKDLPDVRSVALDTSSRTSVVLTKIVFREFLGFEPEWRNAEPDIDRMLSETDAALLIGDPALSIAESSNTQCGTRRDEPTDPASSSDSAFHTPHSALRKFDLAELWHKHTGLGFVFAMWMTKRGAAGIDFAAARDEGLEHIPEIVSNYLPQIGLGEIELTKYLSQCITYQVGESMQAGMELYFELGAKCGLIESAKPIRYLE